MHTNKSILILIGFFICICFNCKSRKFYDDIFSFKETLGIKFLDSSRYEYIYYKIDSSTITNIYNEGIYSKNKNIYTLNSRNLDNHNFDCVLQQKNLADPKTKIRILTKTNIDGFGHEKRYTTIIHFDNWLVPVQGANIDTIIENVNSKTIQAELVYPPQSMPNPSFNTITTKKMLLNKSSNYLELSIPVSYETFYYKDLGLQVLRDDGKYWTIIQNGKKIKKG